MKNAGLFSTLFLDEIQRNLACTEDAKGRLITLAQNWQHRDAASTDTLWRSFIKAALGNLGFVVNDQPAARGLYPLFEDYGFKNCLALIYVIPPGAAIDDESVGCFWPAKLVSGLRERKLTWGILTDGAKWRLYSTKSAKPFEDHVELNFVEALEKSEETAYAFFERFFHADCFTPRQRDDYETEKVERFRAVGLKARKQRQAKTASEDESGEAPEQGTANSSDRAAGIYLCRLDLDGELSEAILEARVKDPLLDQVDNVLRYICNGFIADTKKQGHAYTEDERREVFESSVKLLYRCLFLFYAESRGLLPSETRHAAIYAPHSINVLCREARKFRWNERTDTGGYDLWQQLKGLVQAVNEGDPSYGVMGYNGGLFDDEEERFLGKHRLRNDFLWQALYGLAFVEPPGDERDGEYPIPYEDLEVRHLGEMYEAILEYKVLLADATYLRRRTKKGTQTLLATGQTKQEGDVVIKEGDIYFGETAHERKQSGSYYTPESLVRFLVGKAVIAPLRTRWKSGYRERFTEYLKQTREGYDDASRRGALRSAEERVTQFVQRDVLPYKVCDPAMGSGHFLVAAANLMGDLVVELLAGIEPISGVASSNIGAPNHWRRLVTRHCLYGADLNPLAVNLAKLALWLNCFARDHKLTFLDHHLRCGNTLIGLRDFADLNDIPERRKDTRNDRADVDHTQLRLDKKAFSNQLQTAAQAIATIPNLAEDDTDRQRQAFEDARRELQSRFAPLADLHTAYLMDGTIRPSDYGRLLNHIAAGKSTEDLQESDLRAIWQRVATLQERHHFFHWPLEFPDVFKGDGGGGFSATIGNPPWDMSSANPEDFFYVYDPEFRKLDRKAVLRRTEELCRSNPALGIAWQNYQATINGQNDLFAEPAAYANAPSGRNNLFQYFLLRFLALTANGGHLSILVPSSIYTDKGCAPLRRLMLEKNRLECLYCFSNERYIFPNVHHAFRFAVIAVEKKGATEKFNAFFAIDVRQAIAPEILPGLLANLEEKPMPISMETIRKLSPAHLAVLEFESEEGVQIVERLYDSFPVLSLDDGKHWNASFSIEYMSNTDGIKFSPLVADLIPVIAGKHIWQFDHMFSPLDRGVSEKILRRDFSTGYHTLSEYRIAFRDIAASTNERTCIASMVYGPSVCVETARVLTVARGVQMDRVVNVFLLATLNSFVVDYIIRRMVTSHLSQHIVERLPVPRLGIGEARDERYFWPVVTRALRLICTTAEYAVLWAEVFPKIPAATLDAHRAAPPSYGPAHEQVLRQCLYKSYAALDGTWTPACGIHDRTVERRDTGDRAQTRAEIDALVAHLYGLTKSEFAYILDTFPVLRNKEIKAFGEYQSRRKALEEYDRFAS